MDKTFTLGSRMEVNKFIFLDIDGVLNSDQYYSEGVYNQVYEKLIKEYSHHIAWGVCNIDPKLVERLNKLTEITGSKIVVSSTWRSDSHLQDIFNIIGIKGSIYDVTPYMRERHRGSEIQEWLDRQSEPYEYVILDDDIDILDSQRPHFILVNKKIGLSDKDIEHAVHILNNKKGKYNA